MKFEQLYLVDGSVREESSAGTPVLCIVQDGRAFPVMHGTPTEGFAVQRSNRAARAAALAGLSDEQIAALGFTRDGRKAAGR